MGSLDAFSAALNQHLQYVLGAAGSCPPGGGPAWDEVLRHYRIAPHAAEERAMIVQQMRLTRGATPAEVRDVLVGLRAWAAAEVERLRLDPTVGGSPQLAYLETQLQGFVERETGNYERAIGVVAPVAAPAAPAGPSLGSIFANAQQTSKEVPWANQQYKQVATLTCVHCGGPQETPLDFMCKFCRRPIAGSVKPTV